MTAITLYQEGHEVIYCTWHGRIKDKNSTLSAIKCQVWCIENTAWWLTIQYSCID